MTDISDTLDKRIVWVREQMKELSQTDQESVDFQWLLNHLITIRDGSDMHDFVCSSESHEDCGCEKSTILPKPHPVEKCDCDRCKYFWIFNKPVELNGSCDEPTALALNPKDDDYKDEAKCEAPVYYDPFEKYQNDEEHNNIVAFIIKSMDYDGLSADDILYINHILGNLKR